MDEHTEKALKVKTKAYRTWVNFPKQYTDLLDHFLESELPVYYTGTRKEMLALRHDVYRFFGQLRKAVLLEKENPDNKEYSEVSILITTSIEPTKGSSDTPSELIFKLNPVVKGFQIMEK